MVVSGEEVSTPINSINCKEHKLEGKAAELDPLRPKFNLIFWYAKNAKNTHIRYNKPLILKKIMQHISAKSLYF